MSDVSVLFCLYQHYYHYFFSKNLFERQSCKESQGERKREWFIRLLVHSWYIWLQSLELGQAGATKPETTSETRSWVAESQVHGSFSGAFPGAVAERWSLRGVARPWTDAHMRFRHHGQQPSSLCHNASSRSFLTNMTSGEYWKSGWLSLLTLLLFSQSLEIFCPLLVQIQFMIHLCISTKFFLNWDCVKLCNNIVLHFLEFV